MNITDLDLGRLTWDAIPFTRFLRDPSVNEGVASGAGALVVIGAVAVVSLLTVYRLWIPLFRDWITSVDHKKIGIMYIVLAFVMLLRGVAEGAIMRFNQATASGGPGFLEPDHVGQLFSTHGTIMIFFVATPFVFGLINIIVPLQIGARDMAFPLLNQISLGLTAAAAALIMISLVVGQFSTGGWTSYPPYTGRDFQPGVGPDYWIWSVVLSGFGSTLSGVNFAVTIYKMRAPGMTFMRMPIFTWTALCSAIMTIFAMPPVTVAALMLAADRYMGFHFFTNDLGGNMMNFANLFWLFGHPEVYILILPAYGIFAEIVSVFSAKRLYGYVSLVIATMSIAVMSFTVWLHHFFTMGQAANVNAVFGIATMLIGIPTGIKLFDWMATMFRGRIRLAVPMVYLIGFFFLFTLGGMTGIILANPTVDYQVHNSLFLVAHFHNVLIPGVLFGVLAGYHYWFPKVMGFRLHEGLGRVAAALWVVGFFVTFMPLYVVGLMGMPRRSTSFDNPAFEPWMITAAVGAAIILTAVTALAIQLWVSVRHREALGVPVGDPWDGRTLEWALPAPVPQYNFAVVPEIEDRDAWWQEKERGTAYQRTHAFQDITVPDDSWIGLAVCIGGMLAGFGAVWWIWWLAVLGLALIPLTVIASSFRLVPEHEIPAEEIARDYEHWQRLAAATAGASRDHEAHPQNRGRAAPDPAAAPTGATT